MKIMKAKTFVLLLIIVSLVSCNSDFDYDVYTIENLELSNESLEFLNFYENTDQIVFSRDSRMVNQDYTGTTTLEHSNSQKAAKEDNNEYWIFNKVGDTNVDYDLRSSSYNYYRVEGKAEERTINYEDSKGNTLAVKLINCANIDREEKSWIRMYEAFTIRYSSPCWTKYIKYKTVNYNTNLKGGEYETIMHESTQVDGVLYDDIMELKTPRENAHLKILASESNGPVQIIDQDNSLTWYLNTVN